VLAADVLDRLAHQREQLLELRKDARDRHGTSRGFNRPAYAVPIRAIPVRLGDGRRSAAALAPAGGWPARASLGVDGRGAQHDAGAAAGRAVTGRNARRSPTRPDRPAAPARRARARRSRAGRG
jgi:hypothetical protein